MKCQILANVTFYEERTQSRQYFHKLSLSIRQTSYLSLQVIIICYEFAKFYSNELLYKKLLANDWPLKD